jgi:NYN domain
VSGDEDFVYAVNAVAYKGCRVEIAGFRSNTAPKLIDVSDYFIDLGEIAEKVRKEITPGSRYDERDLHEPLPSQYLHDQLEMQRSPDSYEAAMRVVIEAEIEEEAAEFEAATEFIRITDDH